MPTNKIPIEIHLVIPQKDFDKFFMYYEKEEIADEIIRQISKNREKMIKGETITITWKDRYIPEGFT